MVKDADLAFPLFCRQIRPSLSSYRSFLPALLTEIRNFASIVDLCQLCVCYCYTISASSKISFITSGYMLQRERWSNLNNARSGWGRVGHRKKFSGACKATVATTGIAMHHLSYAIIEHRCGHQSVLSFCLLLLPKIVSQGIVSTLVRFWVMPTLRFGSSLFFLSLLKTMTFSACHPSYIHCTLSFLNQLMLLTLVSLRDMYYSTKNRRSLT